MPNRAWSMLEWMSRLLAGGAAGCGMLVAAIPLFFISFWEPRLLKSDERWGTVFLIAKVGLPISIVLGAMAGLLWRRSRKVWLSRGALVGSCLAIALLSQMLRPTVARVHRGGIGPLYEVIPDTLAVTFCVAALAVVVWHPGSQHGT